MSETLQQQGAASAEPRRWNVRPRESVDSLRSNRFITWMKYALFGLSAALLATLVVWPQVTERRDGTAIDFATVEGTTPDSTMSNARFVGGEAQNINVTAEQVVQDADFPTIVHLTGIAGDTTTADGVWMHLSANKGLFDRETNRLSLNGNVELFSDEGNQLNSDNAVIDLARNEVVGSGPVSGHGPYGRFTANGFEIREAGNTLLLSGGVQLVIETKGTGN